MAKSALPFVCVSCKCDLPHPSAIEQANQVFNGYELQKTSSDSPRTQKRCISIVLRSIIARTSGKHEIPAYARSSKSSFDRSNFRPFGIIVLVIPLTPLESPSPAGSPCAVDMDAII